MARASRVLWGIGTLLIPFLQACGSDSAVVFSDEIASAASRLASSTATETTVRIQPPNKAPYMVIIYPDGRSDEDKELLKALVDTAAQFAPRGAPMVPTLDGLRGTLVVWQKGSLVRYSKGFRSAAEAKKVLVAIKEDGSGSTVTLQRHGGDVFVADIQ
jgi:hypothetical protein